MYRQFAANAKFINATSIEHVLFMTTCVSEIYGLTSSSRTRLRSRTSVSSRVS